MRFKLFFELENKIIDLDYRRSIVSFIKKSLEKYDINYFDKLYHEKDNIIKKYTFAVFFDRAKFLKNEILVEGKNFNVTFSTNNYEYGIILYNAFNSYKKKKFSLNRNSMTLQNIQMLPEKSIVSDEINIKLLSPIVVKSRENNKDTYYSFERKEFYDVIKVNIKSVLELENMDTSILNDFKIIPIDAKKVIVRNYDINLECSIGKFKLYGDKKLLDFLYKVGMGSKRSLGFGCFQIIN